MLIENQDALMTWLTAVLEPLCDADPAALAKYVVALIKKDKPDSELKESMEQQMDVFLLAETQTFIEALFTTLDTKDYVNGPPKLAQKEAEPEQPQVLPEDPAAAVPTVDSTTSRTITATGVESIEQKDHKTSRRSPARRRTSRDRRDRRRSPLTTRGGRFRSRSRSPSKRVGGGGTSPTPFRRRRSSPYTRRSRSRSYSPGGATSARRSSPTSRRFVSRGSTPTKDEDAPLYTPTLTQKRPRCRDYDEKGFCMRGDQCKFDHGNDAVVLEDAPPPVAAAAAVTTNTSVPPPYVPYAEPYVPAAAPVMPPLHLPPPGYADPNVSRKRGYGDVAAGGAPEGMPPHKRFDYNRVGGRGRGRGGGGPVGHIPPGATSLLAVRNIPPNMNSIAHLNNHFARFGTLVNVQVHFEGDPASALVTFAHPREATAAMGSSDAVLGNRFIRMFYHSGHNKGGQSVKERLGAKPPYHKPAEVVSTGVALDGETITKTIVNNEAAKAEEEGVKEEQKAAAIAAIKKNQEVLETKAKIKKAADEKRLEMVKKNTDLRKSKQDLLDNLIGEQKKLIMKIEEKKAVLKPEEKATMMGLLKSLSHSIEKTKEDLKQIVALQQSSAMGRKTFSAIQKELLDAELELFNAQQDGSEATLEIQKKVNQLRLEAAQKGLLPTSKSPRGRGGMRGYSPRGYRGYRGGGGQRGGRGRGGAFVVSGPTSVDRRPTKVLVSGFELDEKEALLEHMGKFGDVLDHVDDESTPSVVVHYKTRREAEQAMANGKAYGDRLLQLCWYTGAIPSDQYHAELERQESEASGLDEHTDVLDDYTPLDPTYLPPGLGEDEEEEEEEEDGDKDESKDESKDEEAVVAEEKEELEEEEEEEEEDERSWKR